MSRPVHFISGLPRSGSTLLAAILRQNPRFSAAMTSPVATLVAALHPKMCGGESAMFFDDAKRTEILRGLFNAYYHETPHDHVVFDTNRTWTSRIPLLTALFPASRIICCVREIGWIIDSIERQMARHPLQLSQMFNFKPGTSVYARVESLMNGENGVIGLPWNTLREAWFGENAGRLLLIPYSHLAKDPTGTIDQLYAELGEAPFSHDFSDMAYSEPDYDRHIGMPELHSIRPKVEYQERRPCIPPDIFTKFASGQFWEKPELNTRNVKIL